ncbi:MAG: CBS domain-containing protein, partial [Anaerolineales bacterium]
MPYPVSNMIEGRGTPVSVNKSDPISTALTIMLENDYSQLPVLDDQDQILGMITYKNILRALKYYQADLDELVVKNAIESADKFDLEDDIFDILPSLLANNAVLITGMGEQLIGIVTNYDTTEYFRKRSEDLMIIEEIELNIRDLIHLTFENDDGIINNENLQKSINRITDHIDDLKSDYRSALYVYMNFSEKENSKIDDNAFENSFTKIYKSGAQKSFDDLTLNELIEVLLSEECWDFHRDTFKLAKNHLRNLLVEVRNTRNHLAHFKGEISPEQRDTLIFCKETLDQAIQNFVKQEGKEKLGETIPVEKIKEQEIIAPVGEETTITSSKYAPLGEYLQGIPG